MRPTPITRTAGVLVDRLDARGAEETSRPDGCAMPPPRSLRPSRRRAADPRARGSRPSPLGVGVGAEPRRADPTSASARRAGTGPIARSSGIGGIGGVDPVDRLGDNVAPCAAGRSACISNRRPSSRYAHDTDRTSSSRAASSVSARRTTSPSWRMRAADTRAAHSTSPSSVSPVANRGVDDLVDAERAGRRARSVIVGRAERFRCVDTGGPSSRRCRSASRANGRGPGRRVGPGTARPRLRDGFEEPPMRATTRHGLVRACEMSGEPRFRPPGIAPIRGREGCPTDPSRYRTCAAIVDFAGEGVLASPPR